MNILQNRLVRLVASVGAVALIVSMAGSVWTVWQKGDIVRERRDSLAKLKAESRDLQKKLAETQRPEFVERVAREKLGLVKPGETVVLVEKSRQPSVLSGQQEISVPNWKRWWKLFF